MSSPVYVKIEGATQGLISSGASTEDSIGNRYQAGHEDEIMAQREVDNRDKVTTYASNINNYHPSFTNINYQNGLQF